MVLSPLKQRLEYESAYDREERRVRNAASDAEEMMFRDEAAAMDRDTPDEQYDTIRAEADAADRTTPDEQYAAIRTAAEVLPATTDARDMQATSRQY